MLQSGETSGEIPEAIIRNAIALSEYLIDHARFVLGLAAGGREALDGNEILNLLRRKGETRTTVRELSRSKGWNVARIRKALSYLEGRGIMRPLSGDRGNGRPSEIWEIVGDA